ncbi:hypothetical protein Q5H93_10300 [Hymenobacter sp. ASUV-10]|uniref:Uncharacterized protein n=1 Tax=Hymenobacter aranciens TaxID=3063996 RepID=A0ABT9BA27_9BACT|nr:hypothetical protein [Hymenobacter sp. ASUV-10]MDO7875122.1 hypothetical protein [Hymenobacter sp. ASUV-10]
MPHLQLTRLVTLVGMVGLTVCTAPAVQAQGQNLYDWGWLNRLGPSELFTGTVVFPPNATYTLHEHVAVDAAGNVVIAGSYGLEVTQGEVRSFRLLVVEP